MPKYSDQKYSPRSLRSCATWQTAVNQVAWTASFSSVFL